MKALIFAAGLGTRLRPLTNNKPKALVEVNGITLLESAIRKLEESGIDEIVVNIHHFAPLMRDFLASKQWKATIHISDETEQLLETGGGMLNARELLEDTDFLVYNVDVATDLDLRKLIDFHRKQPDNLATLAVRTNFQSSRSFLFAENRLAGWQNTDTNEKIISRDSENYISAGFSGIHVVSPKIFSLFTEKGSFSITKTYLRLAQNYQITPYFFDDYWIDLGKPEAIKREELRTKNEELRTKTMSEE